MHANELSCFHSHTGNICIITNIRADPPVGFPNCGINKGHCQFSSMWLRLGVTWEHEEDSYQPRLWCDMLMRQMSAEWCWIHHPAAVLATSVDSCENMTSGCARRAFISFAICSPTTRCCQVQRTGSEANQPISCMLSFMRLQRSGLSLVQLWLTGQSRVKLKYLHLISKPTLTRQKVALCNCGKAQRAEVSFGPGPKGHPLGCTTNQAINCHTINSTIYFDECQWFTFNIQLFQ